MTRELFILGAGSNYNYRFPSGVELKWDVIDIIRTSIRFDASSDGTQGYVSESKDSDRISFTDSEKNTIFTKVKTYLSRKWDGDTAKQTITDFANRFQYSGCNSIDFFLEKQDANIQDTGKCFIGAVILFYERKIKFFRRNVPSTWYGDLFNALSNGKETIKEFGKTGLEIITFNYDRSLEEYLFKSLQNTYHQEVQSDEKMIWHQIYQLKIRHVYGSLSPLKDKIIPYGAILKEAHLDHFTVNIKTISEVKHQDLSHIREITESHKSFHFLGFGYDMTNIENLGCINFKHKNSKIGGTAYKASSNRITNHQLMFDKLRNNETIGTLVEPKIISCDVDEYVNTHTDLHLNEGN